MRTPKPNIRAPATSNREMPPVWGRPTITPCMMTHLGDLANLLHSSGLAANFALEEFCDSVSLGNLVNRSSWSPWLCVCTSLWDKRFPLK
jgi:hypothetical protein